MKYITNRIKRWGHSGRKYLQYNDLGFSSSVYKEFLSISKKKNGVQYKLAKERSGL